MEDNASMLNTQEKAERELVCITNIGNDVQNHRTKLNKEKAQKIESLQQNIGLLKGLPS